MKIAFFGSSLVSAYWNGAATYYRGILKALARLGHDIIFYEPDAFDRQANRDMDDPVWARVVVYPATEDGWRRALASTRSADLVVKASGVGVFDAELEHAVISERRARQLAVFWDVDAPATLDRIARDPHDPMHDLIPSYDMVLTYGGGDRVLSAYERLGARAVRAIYNALDPDSHYPVPPDPSYAGDLAFLGNRLPDREARVGEFFIKAARRAPDCRFLLGGSGWQADGMPANVTVLGHIGTQDHNAFNCSSRVVLNVNRDSMARYGFSPATRIFEAAGAAACIVSDGWEGIDRFLEPGREILIACDGDDVADYAVGLSPQKARSIGTQALARVLGEHTYGHRADEVAAALDLAHAGSVAEAAQ